MPVGGSSFWMGYRSMYSSLGLKRKRRNRQGDALRVLAEGLWRVLGTNYMDVVPEDRNEKRGEGKIGINRTKNRH